MNKPKCQFPGGIVVKPDGVHELDPCNYELMEMHTNATVYVYQCPNCGSIDIRWSSNDETESIIYKEITEE